MYRDYTALGGFERITPTQTWNPTQPLVSHCLIYGKLWGFHSSSDAEGELARHKRKDSLDPETVRTAHSEPGCSVEEKLLWCGKVECLR